MKAIILAAGVGRRLAEMNGGGPKCLLSIGDRTLLARLLTSLGKAGVVDVAIVVGYRADEVVAAIGAHHGQVRVRYVHNPAYEKGAILSLWAARNELDDDVLIMDADVLCPDAMIARLVRSVHANCFLMDGRVQGSGEEQMLMARDGRVLNIARAVEPGYDTIGESVGFLKVSRADAPGLLEALRQSVDAGRDTIEHEEVYPLFMRDHVVGYERVDDIPWAEIDFPDDVAYAARALLPLVDAF